MISRLAQLAVDSGFVSVIALVVVGAFFQQLFFG